MVCDPAYGGQGLPVLLNQCFFEMLNSANQAWTMYPGLSHGAYACLHEHGTAEQKALYLPRLAKGESLNDLLPEAFAVVREGGRLLVADDAGASSALLSAVGLRLTDAPTGQDPLVAGRAGFPVLNAPGTGVFQGVKTLVANHPAAFAGAPQLDAAVRYASGEAFAYHLQDGSGELLFFADPSLFINAMQSAADNGLLSTNLIRWASDDARRTVVVLGGQVTVTGGYSGDGAAHRFSAAKKRLNEQLGQWGAERPSGVSLRFFSAVLLAILCLYAWAVFPGSSGSRRGPLGPGLPSTSVDQLAGRSDGPGAPRASDPPRKTPER